MHVFEQGIGGDISPSCVDKAGALVVWHLEEARRYFESVVHTREESLTDLRGVAPETLHRQTDEGGWPSQREVLRFGPVELRKQEPRDAT